MSGIRRIILDQEMTDLDVRLGHRLVEVAAIETIDDIPTGRVFQSYINPERPVTPEASSVNGLTDEFLADKPKFAEIAQELHDFIGDSPIVVHCVIAEDGYVADREFLNKEMEGAGLPPFPDEQWVNTKLWAIALFGNDDHAASLNRVLDHYGVDRTGRGDQSGHGALLDAELLMLVYPKIRADWEKPGRTSPPPPAPPGP